MPKLPPPPLSPQNRSGFSSSLAVTTLPSAVTTSAETRLSQASPYDGDNHPMPPPSVSPPTPVALISPPVVAKPKTWVPASKSPHVAPPSTRARPARGSTRTLRMQDRSIMSPWSQTALPDTLCPPPLTDRRRSFSPAKLTAAITSDTPAHRTIIAGLRSIIPFQIRRDSSYSKDAGVITEPRNSSTNVSTTSLFTFTRCCLPMNSIISSPCRLLST